MASLSWPRRARKTASRAWFGVRARSAGGSSADAAVDRLGRHRTGRAARPRPPGASGPAVVRSGRSAKSRNRSAAASGWPAALSIWASRISEGQRVALDRLELLDQLPGLGQVGVVAGLVVADQGVDEQGEVIGPSGERLGVARGRRSAGSARGTARGPGAIRRRPPGAGPAGGGPRARRRRGRPGSRGRRWPAGGPPGSPAPRGHGPGPAGRPGRRRPARLAGEEGQGLGGPRRAAQRRRPGRGCAGPRRPGRATCRRRSAPRISLSGPSASASLVGLEEELGEAALDRQVVGVLQRLPGPCRTSRGPGRTTTWPGPGRRPRRPCPPSRSTGPGPAAPGGEVGLGVPDGLARPCRAGGSAPGTGPG